MARSLLWAGFLVLILSSFAWSQATVNEGLETARVYVDVANGSDSNPGTATQPLRTIGAAVSLAETNNTNNIGTRVIINPGVYREVVTVSPPPNATGMPITFQAAIDGTVFVTGAEQYTGWQNYPQNRALYTHSWPYAWGVCNTLVSGAPPAPDIVLRREMLFINGTPLTQVLAFNQMLAGTFYVDESGGTLYIWPPAGLNIAQADIEVAVQPTVWTVRGQSNLVVRGLTFEYANSCRENPAVLVNGISGVSDVLFDTDSFVWNNAQGLSLSANLSYYTVENSVANHNGEAGFQSTKIKYGLFQSDQASYNNWRGAQGAYYNWNNAGAHFYQIHELTLTNLATSYNQTYGSHFDTDNADVTVSSLAGYANLLAPMSIERNEGPITISGSTFCGGILLRESEFVTLTGSNLVNAFTVVSVAGEKNGFQVTNWETGEVYVLNPQNLTLTENVIQSGSGQRLFSYGLGGTYWTNFQTTLSSNYNTWWNAYNGQPFMVPIPKSGTPEDFAGWQTATSQDQQSVYSAPLGNPSAACSGLPDMRDYWFAVPVNAGAITVHPGKSATFKATYTSLGFTSTLQLSDDGVQNIPGATGSWSASTLSPSQTATFTITTSSSTPTGTYTVALLANGANVTRTISVLVTVR